MAGGRLLKGQKILMTWYNPAAKANQASEKSYTAEHEKEKVNLSSLLLSSLFITSSQEEESTTTTNLNSSTVSLDQEGDASYGHFDDDEEEETERSWKH